VAKKREVIFKARLLFAANMLVGFWTGAIGALAVPAVLIWNFRNGQRFPNDQLILVFLLASGIVTVLALIPGRLLAMWPYAIVVEPQNGIWVYGPPAKFWVPIVEIVDIDVYSGMYGGGHAIQLNKSHGLVKQLYISSLFFPDTRIVSEIRSLIDNRDGVR
jgi:hypothetical protein